MTTQDDRIRALERAHAEAPSRETKAALRRALFTAGLDPFPRSLWTPEWVEVFDAKDNASGKRAVSAIGFPCNHSRAGHDRWRGPLDPVHSCRHVKPDASLRDRTTEMEDVERVLATERQSQTVAVPTHAELPSLSALEVHLRGSLVVRGGCTYDIDAWFHDGRLLVVRAIHSPCPSPRVVPGYTGVPYVVPGYTGVPYDAYSKLGWPGRQGRDVTVQGRPVELRPLEEFRVGWPEWQRNDPAAFLPAASTGAQPLVYSLRELEGVLTRVACMECGHAGSRHEQDGPCMHSEPRSGPSGTEQVVHCLCLRFLSPSTACARPGCGHSRANHGDAPEGEDFGLGPCMPGECSCLEFVEPEVAGGPRAQ